MINCTIAPTLFVYLVRIHYPQLFSQAQRLLRFTTDKKEDGIYSGCLLVSGLSLGVYVSSTLWGQHLW